MRPSEANDATGRVDMADEVSGDDDGVVMANVVMNGVFLSTGGFSVAPPSTGDGADEARGLLVGWQSLRKPFRQRRRQPVPGAPRDERGGRTNSCDGVPCATGVEKSSAAPGYGQQPPPAPWTRGATGPFWAAGSDTRPASSRTCGAGCRASSPPGSGCPRRPPAPPQCGRAR